MRALIMALALSLVLVYLPPSTVTTEACSWGMVQHLAWPRDFSAPGEWQPHMGCSVYTLPPRSETV